MDQNNPNNSLTKALFILGFLIFLAAAMYMVFKSQRVLNKTEEDVQNALDLQRKVLEDLNKKGITK